MQGMKSSVNNLIKKKLQQIANRCARTKRQTQNKHQQKVH
jgi:hypothetical protein